MKNTPFSEIVKEANGMDRIILQSNVNLSLSTFANPFSLPVEVVQMV